MLIIGILLIGFILVQLGLSSSCMGINNCKRCDENTSLCLECDTDFQFSKDLLICIPIGSCPVGQFKQEINNSCQNCHPTCKACKGPKEYGCLECIEGYSLVQEFYSEYQICKQCSTPNCSVCSNLQYCMVCKNGYHLNKENNTCNKCLVENCKNCEVSLKECSQCFSPYELSKIEYDNSQQTTCKLKGLCQLGSYLIKPGLCQKCDQSCIHCYGAGQSQCYQCKSDYYMEDQACQKCSTNCLTCQYKSDYCTSCNQGYILNGSKCEQNCRKSEFNNNGQCESCQPNCLSCLDDKTCLLCQDPINNKLINGKCINVCPSGYFNQLKPSDQILWESNRFDQITSPLNCLQCSQNCKECQGGEINCTECNSPLYLSNKQCISQCNPQQYQDYDPYTQQIICLDCILPCLQCSDRNTCTTCINQYTLKDGKCFFQYLQGGFCPIGLLSFSNPSSICFEKCPFGLAQFGTKCFCQQSCQHCAYDPTKQEGVCLVCKKDKYSYQGACIKNCPDKTHASLVTFQGEDSQYEFNSCIMDCSSQQFMIINPNLSRSCVQQCPQNFTQYKIKYCINKSVCPNQTYFDEDLFEILFNSNQILQELKYCKKCNVSCQKCNGPLQIDCITCKEGLFIQEKNLSNQKGEMQCQKQCDQGYFTSKKQMSDGTFANFCDICKINCDSCLSNLYKTQPIFIYNNQKSQKKIVWDKYFCTEECPIITSFDPTIQECKLKVSSKFIFDYNNNSIGNLFLITEEVKFSLEIYTQLEIPQDILVSCTVLELNLFLYMHQKSLHLPNIFSSKIHANTLEEGKIYQLKCIIIMYKQRFDNQVEIETLKFQFGQFTSNQNHGKAIVDKFIFSIQGFKFKNLDPESYQLNYAINAELSTYSTQQTNVTIFQTDQTFYELNPSLKHNFNYSFEYSFPLIKNAEKVKVILKIYCLKFTAYQAFEVYLQPYFIEVTDVSSLIQKIKFESNMNVGSPFSSTQLQKFTNQLTALNLIPKEIKSQQEIQIKSKAITVQQLTDFQLPCNDEIDCSSQGKCLSIITSYYKKCECLQNFKGAKCNWKADDYDKIQEIYVKSLVQLKYELIELNSSLISRNQKLKQFNLILCEISLLGEMNDIINPSMVKQLINLLVNQVMTFLIIDHSSFQTILKISDNLLEAIRKNFGTNNQLFSKYFTMIVNNTFSFIQNHNTIALTKGQKIEFNFESFSVLVQDLSITENTTINIFKAIDQPFQVSFQNEEKYKISHNALLTAVKYPIDLQQQRFSKEIKQTFNMFASDIIDIKLNEKQNPQKEFEIKNLNTTILIEIPLNDILDIPQYTNKNLKYVCVFLDKDQNWSSFGLLTHLANAQSIICESNHLTKFAVLILENIDIKLDLQHNPDISESSYQSQEEFEPKVFTIVNIFLIFSIQLGLICWNSRKKFLQINKIAIPKQIYQEEQQQTLQSGKINNLIITLKSLQKPSLLQQSTQEFTSPIQNTNEQRIQKSNQQNKEENHKINSNSPSPEVEICSIKQIQISQQYLRDKFIAKVQQQLIKGSNSAIEKQYGQEQHYLSPYPQSHQSPLLLNNELTKLNSEMEQQQNFQITQQQNDDKSPIQNEFQDQQQIKQYNTLNNQQIQQQQQQQSLEQPSNLEQYNNINQQKDTINSNQLQTSQEFETSKQFHLIYYHPFYTFTRNLQYVQVNQRILLFFYFITYYQMVSMLFLIDGAGDIKEDVDIITFILCFFATSLLKAFLPYLVIGIIKIVEVCENKNKIKQRISNSKLIFHFITFILQLVFLVTISVVAEGIHSYQSFQNFGILTIINIIIDFTLIEYVSIKLLDKLKLIKGIQWLKFKNQDIDFK